MIITISGYKGGSAKTQSAIHLSAYFHTLGSTVLIDGDENRSASNWAKRGGGLPFRVVDARQAALAARDHQHTIIDTQARPSREDLEVLVGGCDTLILPSPPDALALDALMLTVDTLRELDATRYKVLLTIVPPRPSRDGDEARALLVEAGLPLFTGQIRRAVAFQKAALLGVTVADIRDPRAQQAWQDYVAIGKELLP